MKALVLCAGRGTRLRPLTYTRAKAAVPLGGQPVLTHILTYLGGNGFMDVGVVISPDQEELRRLGPAFPDQSVTFLVQRDPHGIAHAVQCARRFLGESPFLLYLGDNLTNEDLQLMLAQFAADRPDGMICVREVPNPRQFGVAVVDGAHVVQVVEKPREPVSNLAIAGIYLFSNAVHDAIRHLRPSARGELEITDAIAWMLAKGRTVLAHRLEGWWQDMGSPEGMVAANALILDEIGTRIPPGLPLDSVQVQGRVFIEEGAILRNVRLRGPIWIGAGCEITDSYIGPYTSVGEGSVIQGASVENSILLPGCRLAGPSLHLEDCVLGRGAVVEVKSGRTMTMVLGDDGRLLLPPDRR